MTRKYLDIRYDVTDLTPDEAGALAGEAYVQAEASDDHPSVTAEIEWNEVEVEDEPRTILVHLNVTVPVGDKRGPEAIAAAIEGAIEVGSDDDLVRDLTIANALAEEV